MCTTPLFTALISRSLIFFLFFLNQNNSVCGIAYLATTQLTMVIVEEDAALEPPIQAKRACPACCCFSYRVPTLRELYSQDKRLLRAILLIVVLLFNAPVGKYLLYPFMIFSTWIHELFHGVAALTVGGSIAW